MRLRGWCASQGLTLAVEQEFPGFRRFRISDGTEATLVDLVHEPVAQVVPPPAKPIVDGIRIDPLEEIVANKLAAVLGRGEVKDLVDLFALHTAGVDVLAAFPGARAKAGGMEPATLAWVLDEMSLDTTELLLVQPVDPEALRAFRDDLVERLQRTAWPI